MFRRFSVGLALALLVTGLAVGAASAAVGTTEPAPTQGELMIDGMAMSREMMMADIQGWIAPLPPGITTLMTKTIHHLTDEELMMLHYEMHHTNLLQEPPGQLLKYIRAFGHTGH